MKLLKLAPFANFKRFVFKDPDTQHEYQGRSLAELHANIVRYRLQNGLDLIEFLPAVTEHYMCALPENAGACVGAKIDRGVLGILKGGITLFKNFYYGDENIVDRAEADRRADICVACPLNTKPSSRRSEKTLLRVAEASVGDRKSKHYEQLGVCAGCS